MNKNLHKHLKIVFDKPMNRKEFLGYMLAGFLAIIGVTGMLKAVLHHSNKSSSQPLQGLTDNYGSTPYGGT